VFLASKFGIVREELRALEAIFPANATAGLRYPEEVMKLLDR
jgi:hypothetical protein